MLIASLCVFYSPETIRLRPKPDSDAIYQDLCVAFPDNDAKEIPDQYLQDTNLQSCFNCLRRLYAQTGKLVVLVIDQLNTLSANNDVETEVIEVIKAHKRYFIIE